MTISIGIDLTSSDAVAESLHAHGTRYLERVYTDRERRDCVRQAGHPDADRLAARFAAKEATLKALRRGGTAIARADGTGRGPGAPSWRSRAFGQPYP